MSNQQLHYETLGGMLVRSNGMLRWRCPACFASGESYSVLEVCPKCEGEKNAERTRQ